MKKYNDGNEVKVPVGFGEALSGIQEEKIVDMIVALVESLEAIKAHTNALQNAALSAADFSAFKSAVATSSIPAATNTLKLEDGLRN